MPRVCGYPLAAWLRRPSRVCAATPPFGDFGSIGEHVVVVWQVSRCLRDFSGLLIVIIDLNRSALDLHGTVSNQLLQKTINLVDGTPAATSKSRS